MPLGGLPESGGLEIAVAAAVAQQIAMRAFEAGIGVAAQPLHLAARGFVGEKNGAVESSRQKHCGFGHLVIW